MKIMQKLVEQLTGPEMVDALVEQMLEHIEGFREEHMRYVSALERLKEEQGIDKVVTAIYKRTATDLLFAGFLGLKMNWDHFANPMTPNCTWTQIDYKDYLREDLAHSLPDYQHSSAVLSDFYQPLTVQQRDVYDAIMEYDTHLQTVGPKLAHYYGYLLGDTLLYQLIPGYHADAALTCKYNSMLGEYFGKVFLPTVLSKN